MTDLPYSGFPFWHALLIPPGKEARTVKFLMGAGDRELLRIGEMIYLPRCIKHVSSGRGKRRVVMTAVVPGMAFAPIEILQIPRRDEIFELACVRGFIRNGEGYPSMIRKDDIEVIRRIEADLDLLHLRSAWKTNLRQVPALGARIRFKSGLYSAFLGGGTVTRIENGGRIRVCLSSLLGQPREIVVPLADVEADVMDAAA